MKRFEHVIFASYGNDSVALLQWALESKEIQPATTMVVHSDTGWAAESWAQRVDEASSWARGLGFATIAIPSIGMRKLVQMKKGWPRQGLQFCTDYLKIRPAREWLESVDTDRELVCLVGVRREESRARAQWPEWTEESDRHGGRSLYSPLVRHTDDMRNALVARTPFKVLPHRSQECFPCVN